MSIAREPVEIRASNGTLWIGDNAYPLHTLTRATTAELEPNRKAAVERYAVTVAMGLFPATIVSALTPDIISVLVTTTALTWFAIRTVRLVQFLTATLHELTIETTRGRHRALVSDNPRAVSDLAFRITDAINNPHTEFRTRTQRIANSLSPTKPIREEPPDRITQP